MEETLHHRVVGRMKPLAVSNAVRRAQAGLADPQRPNGSFLFWGLLVGKTELSKALADYVFDSEQAMVRIVVRVMEQHSVARLIGAPRVRGL